MFDRFIVASSEELQRDSWFLLAELLRDEIADPDSDVIVCTSPAQVEKLRRQNRRSRDLVIVEADFGPSCSEDGGSGPAKGGIDLVERLQSEAKPAACILVAHFDASIFSKVQNWPLCTQLPFTKPNEADLCDALSTLAKALANKRDSVQIAPTKPASKWALLEIHLDSANPAFSLHIGSGGEIEDQEPLSYFELDTAELSSIVRDSRALRIKISERLRDPQAWEQYVGKWHEDYAKLGHRVFKLISKDDFQNFWGRAWQHAQDNARLRFRLNEDAYDGLWESMYDERKDKWLMLKGTIARRARVSGNPEVRALDGGDGAIHMLAIGSNVQPGSDIEGPPNPAFERLMATLSGAMRAKIGGSVRAQHLFPQLQALEAEMKSLKALAEESRLNRNKPLLVIDFLDEVGDRPLHELVKEKLTVGPVPAGRNYRYDVVHFAGHAMFEQIEGASQRGYLIFGNHAGSTHAVPISEYAQWLRKADVQLAYLNCCRSSAARAAYEIANSEVPLAIGFTWDLDSQGAVLFADTFYRHLLENDAKVCPAFQHARRELHTLNQEDDPIWTAPVLVAQPSAWDKVETCFVTTH